MKLTKKDFEAYEKVRKSGVTNMLAIKFVMGLSGLTKEQCFYIMEHYEELDKKYGEQDE